MNDTLHIRDALLGIIRSRIDSHPRSQQKDLGPSEIGHPCDRWMAYKLNDTPTVKTQQDKWRPTVGTAVHSWLSDTFEGANSKLEAITGAPVFFVEKKVSVGQIYNGDGKHVYGGCDLFYARTVIDWKIVAKTTLETVRKAGHPGAQYRTQVHSYGRGWQRQGKQVDNVAVFFLPSSGTLDQAQWWSEPYDETVCTDALDRVSRIAADVKAYGVSAPAMAKMTAHHCRDWCEWYRPGSDDATVACGGLDVKPSGWDGLLGP